MRQYDKCYQYTVDGDYELGFVKTVKITVGTYEGVANRERNAQFPKSGCQPLS